MGHLPAGFCGVEDLSKHARRNRTLAAWRSLIVLGETDAAADLLHTQLHSLSATASRTGNADMPRHFGYKSWEECEEVTRAILRGMGLDDPGAQDEAAVAYDRWRDLTVPRGMRGHFRDSVLNFFHKAERETITKYHN